MTPRMKQGLLLLAFAALGIIAVAGWTRTPAAVGVNSFNAPGVYTANQAPSPMNGAQPVSYDANGRAIYGQTGYQPTPAYNTAYAPAYGQAVNCVEPMGYQNVAYAQPVYAAPRYVRSYRPRVIRSSYVERDRDYVVRRKRSTGKSIAIVAGSAGAGAAIGALAGGGKGAAIGGLTGGVAGFVYDRLTHNR